MKIAPNNAPLPGRERDCRPLECSIGTFGRVAPTTPRAPATDADLNATCLTLAWATPRERHRVIAVAASEGRQTMNLRTMPGAELVVLRRPDGGFAGWAGMDAASDPSRPELFSQFVYPEFRGVGLGALLEHVWWAYLASRACPTGYMRMELASNRSLFQHRLASGYCRQMTAPQLGARFVSACRHCELYGDPCAQQAYLAVDVAKALAASVRARGPFDIDDLPVRVDLKARSPGHPRVSHAACAT